MDEYVIIEVEVPEAPVTVADLGHFANLAVAPAVAEYVSSQASQWLSTIRADDDARADWMRLLEEGMKLLPLAERRPAEGMWDYASDVVHPAVARAMVDFQSSTVRELFPPTGPAAPHLFGLVTPERQMQGRRVADYINYLTLEGMPDFKRGFEQLLAGVGVSGSWFRKLWWDPVRRTPCAKHVAPQNLILPYGATGIHDAPRWALRELVTIDEWRMNAAALGWTDGPEPTTSGVIITNDLDQAAVDVSGIEPNYQDRVARYYEFHVMLDAPELFGPDEEVWPSPFVAFLDENFGTVRGIYREWSPDDPSRKRIESVVQYDLIPSPWGPYAFGYIHLLGALTDTGTALMRQVVDNGTRNNVPSGFKNRDLRVAQGQVDLAPGEFADVDLPSGKVSDHLEFVPHRPTDPNTLALLQLVSAEAEKLATVAEIKASDASGAAAGAMLAVMERAYTTFSATHSRTADSLARELSILRNIVASYMPGPYPYPVEGDVYDKAEDFRAAIGVRTVADPTAATQALRVMRDTASLALASQDPDLYDRAELHRQAQRNLGRTDVDRLIPMAEDVPRRDPLSENMALMQGRPVKVFMDQDHAAHLQVHMQAMQDPAVLQFVGQSSQGPKIQAAAQAHIMEHLAFAYRQQVEQALGVALPPPGEPLPAEIENQIARLVAQAQIPGLAPLLGQQQAAPDPVAMQRERELDLKAKDLEIKELSLALRAQAEELRAETARQQNATRAEIAQLNAEVEILRAAKEAETRDKDRAANLIAVDAKNEAVREVRRRSKRLDDNA